jgi:hypothetical protein
MISPRILNGVGDADLRSGVNHDVGPNRRDDIGDGAIRNIVLDQRHCLGEAGG